MVRRVSFWAKKPIKKRMNVCFRTKNGRRICFRAVKKLKKPIRVVFYTKRR